MDEHEMIPAKRFQPTGTMDILGRAIRAGDVCGLVGRRRATVSLEIIVVRSVQAGIVKGDKIIRELVEDQKGKKWVIRLKPTRPIQHTQHLIIIGLTEQEAIELMHIK